LSRRRNHLLLRLGLGGRYADDPFLLDAAAALDPASGELDEAVRFSLCRPEPLRLLWLEAGLTDIEVRSIDVSVSHTPYRPSDRKPGR
jgi:hypothetical protein